MGIPIDYTLNGIPTYKFVYEYIYYKKKKYFKASIACAYYDIVFNQLFEIKPKQTNDNVIQSANNFHSILLKLSNENNR